MGKQRTAFESAKPVKAQAPAWTPPPRTPEPAPAASPTVSAPVPETAYHETTVLPAVVLDQEPVHPAPETLVLAGSLGELREESDDSLDFPSFGELSGGTGRRRARPALPDPAEPEERQW